MKAEADDLGPDELRLDDLRVGDVVSPLTVGPIAHGGHWVARHDGRVVFVRHTLAGEVVAARITEVRTRFARADAVEVLERSPQRVAPPCPVAGRCGGCDLQHVAIAHQRVLKAAVIAEQLRRLAGLEREVVVEAVEPDALGWRTRMRYHGSDEGWGLRAHRSSDVVPVPAAGCPIAAPLIARPDASGRIPAVGDTLVAASAADGVHWVGPGEAVPLVVERAAGRTWSVRADGFWQVHPAAADTLVSAVLAGLEPRAGERALDLYCGVGLFAGALADRRVRVTGVDGSRQATGLAARNVPGGRFVHGSVAGSVGRLPGPVDLVVLDPPRAGAGRAVMEAVLERRPRRIAYVACDPAALARDLATALAVGWRVTSLRAFDLFAMTHHVECVAVLEPGR